MSPEVDVDSLHGPSAGVTRPAGPAQAPGDSVDGTDILGRNNWSPYFQ